MKLSDLNPARRTHREVLIVVLAVMILVIALADWRVGLILLVPYLIFLFQPWLWKRFPPDE